MDYNATGLDGRYEYRETGKQIIQLLPEIDNESLTLALAALRPGSKESIAKHVGKLALHKKVAKESGAGVAVLINDYVQHLAELSEMAINNAITEIIDENENPFFPQLASIKKLVIKHQSKLEDYYYAVADALNTQKRLESKEQFQTRRADEAKEENMNELTRKADKKSWFSHEWEKYISEAKTMSDSLKSVKLDASYWDGQVIKRQAEFNDFNTTKGE